ncbi:MAG: cation:proton antiporter [Desulfocapsa sp.]|nr:cation:proton antiporter [Desulfocapsa sp.]
MGVITPIIKKLPITSSIIYLAIGILLGPMILGLFHFNPLKESVLLEILTEVAVLISLFAAGVKMPVPVTFARWRAPILLAFFAMTVSVGLVTLFAYYMLGLPLGAAVLLGAIVAPTDPVLATDVQIRQPDDHDRFRFILTCEAGMNDGSAFPFIMLGLGLLGLHELGNFGLQWLLVDVLWATGGGIAIGVAGGTSLAYLVDRMHRRHGVTGLLDDFLGLGLIGTVYGLSVLCSTWGFLAVFFAAVALRQTELRFTGNPAVPQQETQNKMLEGSGDHPISPHQVSRASLVFKEHLERLSEVLLVLIIGGTLFLDSWSWRALGFALFLFALARPLSVLTCLLGTRTPWRIRGMAGWFGVRGIGSLYYLMYVIQYGVSEEISLELIHLTLVVVALSIVVHGISVKPVMKRFGRRRE